MTRRGDWVLLAGLAVLAAGLLNAPPRPAQGAELSQSFALDGVEVLDLGTVRAQVLTLGGADALVVRYPRWLRSGAAAAFAVRRPETGVLRLQQQGDRSSGETTLAAPASLQLVRGDQLHIIATAPVTTLQLEGKALRWERGDANRLDVRLRPAETDRCPTCSEPQFTFEAGAVQALRVHAVRGTVVLEDLDAVADITLELGPDARVSARHRDLPRIRIEPLDPDPADVSMLQLEPCRGEQSGDTPPAVPG